VADVVLLEVPVEAGLELGAIVRLEDQHPEGERRMTSSTNRMAEVWLQAS